MRTQRLGCLTPIGLTAAIITALLISGAIWLGGGSIFSPGKLNDVKGAPLGGYSSHAETAGKCENCHTAPWDTTGMTVRCLQCHEQIMIELADPKTLHGELVKDPAQVNCLDCHTEHHGPEASLTRLDIHDFPHEVTGFALTAHRKMGGVEFQCKNCHQDFTRVKNPVCSDCHTRLDRLAMASHKAAFGVECRNCHDGIDTYGAAFDHNAQLFSLKGKHAQIQCSDCHLNQNNLEAVRATPMDCASCHLTDDTHGGGLGTDCASCHTTDGWKPTTFDHNTRTKFPLSGKHIDVKCETCHLNHVYEGTSPDCKSCHKDDDFHKGQYGTDCALCHSPTAWKPSTFDHNAGTRFPLQGKHVGVECVACHQDAMFVGTPLNCAACHSKDDPHQGKLASTCDSCHTVNGWKPSTFDHSRSSFKLTGKHASVQCGSCHKALLFKGTPQSCAGCHSGQDPHKGALGSDCSRCHSTIEWKPSTFNHSQAAFQLTGRHISVNCSACHADQTYKGTPTTCYACHKKNDTHNGSMGTDCSACHSTSAWKPSTFDHNRAAFKLTGAHSGAACGSCHPGGSFKGTPSDCYACHKTDDAHNGSMGTSCSSCHTTSAWKPSTFNHNNSGFPLTGAHSGLACSRCHSGGNYSGVPTACAACHAEPAIHAGAFGTDCAGCHNTSAWLPASYNGPHNFPMSHGNANGCRDCHTSSYSSYDCFHCHNQNEMNDKHKEVNGFTYDCLQCHANGQKNN
jgi:hypothetical protein